MLKRSLIAIASTIAASAALSQSPATLPSSGQISRPLYVDSSGRLPFQGGPAVGTYDALARLYTARLHSIVVGAGGIRLAGNKTAILKNTVVPGGVDGSGYPTGELGGTYEDTPVSHRFYPIFRDGRLFTLTAETDGATSGKGDHVALYGSAISGAGNGTSAPDMWAMNTVTTWKQGTPDAHLSGYELDFNNNNEDPGHVPAKLKNGLGIASGGRYPAGNAIQIANTFSFNQWNRGIEISAGAVRDVGINIAGNMAEHGTIVGSQLYDGRDTIFMSRATDTAPTGSFLSFVNAANTSRLFYVAIDGAANIGTSATGARLGISPGTDPAATPTGTMKALVMENNATANSADKAVGAEFWGRDTINTQKVAAGIRAIPADANWVDADLIFYVRGGESPLERFRIKGNGHLATQGAAPTLSNCGASASVSGNDVTGEITVGTSATGCTLSFTAAWTNPPSCTVTSQAGTPFAYVPTTSALTLTNTGSNNLSGTKVNYTCLGK